MIFWDSSAIVPLVVAESTTRRMLEHVSNDPDLLVWWGSYVECVSALARRERENLVDAKSLTEALARLKALSNSWNEVEASEAVRQTAVRFLRVHPLRGADALQLAAAFVGAGGQPQSLTMLTLDDGLAAAASKEGFVLLPSR